MHVTRHRHELLQQRCQAIGIKVWYPRQPMPGSRLVWSAPELPPTKLAPPEPDQTDQPVQTAPVQSKPAQHPKFEVVRQTALGVEFVQHWWLHQGTLLLDTRPVDCSGRLQAEADQLLSALLRVCTQHPRPEVFWSIDWPLFEHRGIKHDWQEAQFYVQQRWQTLLAEHAVARVLALGADTRKLLGFAELPSEQAWIEAESSLQLMQSGAAKRQLWQKLQAWLAH